VERGNHKSALKYLSELSITLKKEIQQGWMFPFPLSNVSCLDHGELAPIGMDDKQWSDLPDGSKKVKLRLTHDQSFKTATGKSVNDRVLTDHLEPLYYGGCLSRLIYYIISIRLRHPSKNYGREVRYKSSVPPHYAAWGHSSKMHNHASKLSSPLTFGGSPCPNEFCLASELITDLANDILHCAAWDPVDLTSPHALNLQPPESLNDSIPFAQAQCLDVELPPDDWGRVDNFIDDGIVITPHLGNNTSRAIPAMLLAIHTLFRPVDTNERVQRDDCLSLGKLKEEGFLSETPTILGWYINTRSLTIHLTPKKFQVWAADLADIIISKKISYNDMEKTIGRLNHAATACPIMRYFLNRIRHVLTNWDQSTYMKKVKRYLPTTVLEDLKLRHTHFLPKIHKGLSLNLISYRRPSVVSWSDACPHWMGRYDSYGNAWQFQLSEEDRIACYRQNNSLEFVSALITVWVAIGNNNMPHEACFLALSDNSSTVGWMHKANIDNTKNLPLHVAARKYAEVLLQADCCLYSQHIAGVTNTVADLLSRKFDLPHSKLSSFIRLYYPKQVPPSFNISPLPPEICSWLTSWLQRCRERWASQKEQKTRKNEHGTTGSNTLSASGSKMTYGSNYLPQTTKQLLSEPLQLPSGEDTSPNPILQTWLQAQSKRPLQN
jgi:hypothetical protein